MEHVKLHKKLSLDEGNLARQVKWLDRKDRLFARDIVFPEYKQLYYAAEDSYKACGIALRLHLATGDERFFPRALAYLDCAIDYSETLLQGLLNRSGQPLTLTVQGQSLTLPCAQQNKSVVWVDWSDYLCIAISRRAHRSVAIFMQYTPQMASDYTDDPSPEAAFYVRYLQGMLSPKADHDSLQQELTHYFRQYPSRCTIVLKPFYYLAKEDEAGFEAAIFQATKVFKEAVKLANSTIGLNAFGFYPPQLLAAASLAYDRHGWTLKHKSDYLPEWWIYNRFEAPDVTK